jgi:hypothetical protein
MNAILKTLTEDRTHKSSHSAPKIALFIKHLGGISVVNPSLTLILCTSYPYESKEICNPLTLRSVNASDI